MRNVSKKRTSQHTRAPSHLGGTTSEGLCERTMFAVEQARVADKPDCPYYGACLARAAKNVRGKKFQRSVCAGGCPNFALATALPRPVF